MNKVEQARQLIQDFKNSLDTDKLTENEKTQLKLLVNTDNDTNALVQYEKDVELYEKQIDDIIRKYNTAILCVQANIEKDNQKIKDEVEDDFDINEENAEELAEDEEIEETDDNEFYDRNEFKVVETTDGEKQAKKGNNIFKILGVAAAVGAIAFALTKIGGCAAKNNNVVVPTSDDNESKTEETTNDVVTTNDIVIETTNITEPEVDINELIAEELAKFDGGNSTISAEEYEFMLNFVNDNLNKPIEPDNVASSFIEPAVQSVLMHDMTNLMNGVDDGTYDVGNFSFNNLVLENTITKEKIADLEVLRAGMLDKDPEVQKASAKQVLYILHQIGRQVTNTKETILIDGEEYNGVTINGTTFDKYYQTEFYELNDASDQVLYLTDLYSLAPLCKAILGDNVVLETVVKIDDEEVKAQFTYEDSYNAIYVEGCGETDENGLEMNLYSSKIDESVKSNNRSLENKGYSIILK